MRAVSAAPVIYLNRDDDGQADTWTDDEDDELPLALRFDDGPDPDTLTPPFDFAGLVDVPDNMPTRRRDGKIHQAPQWTDAHGLPVSQLDLWRWGHWLHDIVMDDYPTREEYEAAWHAADAEIQAVNRHAWHSLHAAGVYHDDKRRLWLKRPQAV
jgi:hypothetical protein